ncbi:MAG TPA: LTA synthase family protein [Candidatus Binatia bacterium]|nr:LTA synthase family protein [Candidatus Binatia bacterium]
MPRTTFSIAAVLAALLIFMGFRLKLYFERRAELRALALAEHLRIFWVGLRLDAVIVSRTCAPIVLFALVLPDAYFVASRPFLLGYLGVLYFVCLFAEICGLYFFCFYDCRLNYLVFEHGADREVVKTVLREYPVARIFFISLVGAAACLYLVAMTTSLGLPQESAVAWRWDRAGSFFCLLVVAFATRGTFDHRPLNPSFASITTNRIANEIASCGVFNLLTEWMNQLREVSTALQTLIKLPTAEEAVRLARERLSTHGSLTDDSSNPLVRQVNGRAASEPLNVVLVMMESFTGSLVGCLGGQPALSPELDKLASEGVLLKKCYATGERTIQALEAAVSSFPPLPGVGVIKRPQARAGFSTLATVLKERDYETLFIYGGQGIFDEMRAFFMANGFDRFIEEKDFLNPTFRSTWGVSDEDLFHRADQEFSALDSRGRPFFATILTVSLHSPWEYPPDRMQPLPVDFPVPAGFKLAELNNFLYADYAIGKFIRDARQAPYFDRTLFVFVGDHGVHLRGADLVPIDEYRVPALFFCPSRLSPRQIAAVTSQIDLPPTIMAIIGGAYRSPFFGRDVIHHCTNDPFAMAIYNKKRYGIVTERELIIMSENGERLSYERNRLDGGWRQAVFSTAQRRHADQAAALLRVAEDLLVSSRYTSIKG